MIANRRTRTLNALVNRKMAAGLQLIPAFLQAHKERPDLFRREPTRHVGMSMDTADLLGDDLLKEALPELKPRLIVNRETPPQVISDRGIVADWLAKVRHAMAENNLSAEAAWAMVKGADLEGFRRFVSAAVGGY